MIAEKRKLFFSFQLSAQTAALAAAAAAATSMQVDDDEAAAAATIPPAKAVEGFTAAKSGAFSLATTAIKRVSDMRLDLDADYNAQAKASCIKRILTDLSLADDQKEKEIATLYKCWGTQPHAVSSFRFSNRSSPPESFHGLANWIALQSSWATCSIICTMVVYYNVVCMHAWLYTCMHGCIV